MYFLMIMLGFILDEGPIGGTLHPIGPIVVDNGPY